MSSSKADPNTSFSVFLQSYRCVQKSVSCFSVPGQKVSYNEFLILQHIEFLSALLLVFSECSSRVIEGPPLERLETVPSYLFSSSNLGRLETADPVISFFFSR